MSTKNGFLQGYNAQAVANEDQVIVSAEVTDEQNDKAQLHPMIDATNESLERAGIDERPATLLADAGYASEENFAALDEGHLPPRATSRPSLLGGSPFRHWRSAAAGTSGRIVARS